ncbi:MAG: hypothetical protein WCR36_03125 [Bacteroidaceae bacterium]
MEKKKWMSIAVGVLLVLVVCLGFLLYTENKTKKSLVQEFVLEKEDLENEYTLFAQQYDELQIKVKNDSLDTLLDKEQTKVRELLSELKMVKESNASEIRRLKNELASLRKVMRSFIQQIDSLNKINAQQKVVIATVTNQYKKATKQRDVLQEQKKVLDERVALAAQLDATNIVVRGKTQRKQDARRIKDVRQIEINFTLTKNITAVAGERTVYARILKPDNELLSREPSGLFRFENKDISYSIKKYVEYTGEEQQVTLYWDVQEFLYKGTYRIDLFADGIIIGTGSYTISK